MSFICFSRKKDRAKALEPSSLSAGSSPLKLPRSRPTSQNALVRRSFESKGLKDWECGLCRGELVEPRLLGCLHSFCTRCLFGLHHDDQNEWEEADRDSVHHYIPGSAFGASAGSGYESDLRVSESDASLELRQLKYGIITKKVSGKTCSFIVCPTCGWETALPLGGVSALPLNYVLLRRLATRGEQQVLCDMCCGDNTAETRCNQCLVSVCASCGEAHSKQKGNARHFLQPLQPLARFCGQHPKQELTLYCATCQMVICRDCCVVSHAGHAAGSAARAAAERAKRLRDACERAKHVPENVERANRILEVHAMEVDTQAARVEGEIRAWSEQYRRAVEAHGRGLCAAAVRARANFRDRLADRTRELEERADQAVEAVRFAEELLSEGKEEEILSLSGCVLRRLERLTELHAAAPRCELKFAPTAPAQHDPLLMGRLFTLTPDPDQCVLDTEGLQDLKVNTTHTAVLELRDSNGDQIWYNGENVAGYFRRSDSSARPAAAAVSARADGTCGVRVTPRAPGAYLLAVTLDNTPIKGSPFPCAVRLSKKHSGQFHCCSFCSSGGRRDAACGCGAEMGGGYKGCGHGHAGWPGTRHWSCCGSTRRKSPCTRPTTPRLYQFSL
ncbi:tripartite motif-containing protein 45 isoform X2 [Aricia agestis]|uniref:tripartite motif-containing protein 45 isoform X2 n=1 Tax=Aricia agestis TaxID=91739 RepID=UPI001C204FD3|nr:tripartite motif-containing protein 45 isoform X2 [Aricia agestis]